MNNKNKNNNKICNKIKINKQLTNNNNIKILPINKQNLMLLLQVQVPQEQGQVEN